MSKKVQAESVMEDGKIRVFNDFQKRFTACLPIGVINDEKISFRAKGLLVYLWSLPDDYDVTLQKLVSAGPDGRGAVTSAMQELIDAGYVERSQSRNNGVFGSFNYTLHHSPSKK